MQPGRTTNRNAIERRGGFGIDRNLPATGRALEKQHRGLRLNGRVRLRPVAELLGRWTELFHAYTSGSKNAV